MRSYDGADFGQLSEERFWTRDRRDRREVGALHRVQRQRLTGSSAVKVSGEQMQYRNRNVRRSGRNCPTRGFHQRSVGSLSRDDHQVGASCRVKRLTPRAGREEPWRTRPRIRVHEEHVHVSASAAMLKCIIEDDDIDTLRDRLSDAARAIRRDDHRDSWIQPLMHDRFIVTITTKHDSRPDSALENAPGNPCSEGCFSRAANRHVSDAHYRNRKIFSREHTGVVEPASAPHNSAIGQLQRGEQRAQRPRPHSSTRPHSLRESAKISHPLIRLRRSSNARSADILPPPHADWSRVPLSVGRKRQSRARTAWES